MFTGPNIVRDGLILYLDSRNNKSYSGTGDIFNDISGSNNHHNISNLPQLSNNRFTLNGTNQGFFRNNSLNGATSTCTVVIWYSTTDIQELWIRGNQNNNFYLSASNNNTYYHSNVGTGITNWINLQSVSNPNSAGFKNGLFNMWEAKNVNFTSWTYYEWFGYYPSGWQMAGQVSTIMVYNKNLTITESQQNYNALNSNF
jgi:hypothetical protein